MLTTAPLPKRARRYRDPVPLADTMAAAVLARVPPEIAAGVWRRGAETIVGVGAEQVVMAEGPTAFEVLDTLAPATWVGWLAFELGHAVEPVVSRGASAREGPAVPDLLLARFGATASVDAHGGVSVRGDGEGRHLLDLAVRDLPTRDVLTRAVEPSTPSTGRHAIEDAPCWSSSLGREEFEAGVETILELLRAGECYQVNLTRRLTSETRLDPSDLYSMLAHRHPAPYSGMLRVDVPGFGPVAVVTAAPERYLRVNGRRVETRPIKGTAVTPATLQASAKDRAENVMIVDLARNDLGRVCEPGSITVPSLFALEAHPGLHHLVSTVRGTRRDDVGWGALAAATFPPASVTGAPKPRVLQAIEDLEPVRRGVYCGAFGWIDTAAVRADLAVAIRTFTLFPDRSELAVGAGIVADSSPAAEWDETELKAARLLTVAGAAARERTAVLVAR